jgi:hypothetical protein
MMLLRFHDRLVNEASHVPTYCWEQKYPIAPIVMGAIILLMKYIDKRM